MKIAVLDIYNAKRDLAQMDMYSLLREQHDVILMDDMDFRLVKHWADVLYLGILHPLIPNIREIIGTLNIPIIIDQADNRDFLIRYPKMNYSGLSMKKVILSRYLPNLKLEERISLDGIPVKQLTWYINPDRFPAKEKNIDVSFVCQMKNNRFNIADLVIRVCKKNGWSCHVSMVYGYEYSEVLSHTKVFVAECDRKCLTQKYGEASLAGCVIVGDKPLYPANDIDTVETNWMDLEDKLREALQLSVQPTKVLSDKDRFWREFNEILLCLK